jgi:hypothetical protein
MNKEQVLSMAITRLSSLWEAVKKYDHIGHEGSELLEEMSEARAFLDTVNVVRKAIDVASPTGDEDGGDIVDRLEKAAVNIGRFEFPGEISAIREGIVEINRMRGEKLDAFRAEILAACEKHGFSIAPQDAYVGLEIIPRSDRWNSILQGAEFNFYGGRTS